MFIILVMFHYMTNNIKCKSKITRFIKEIFMLYHPGIYIHVPYCLRKCAYCNFYSLENYKDYAQYSHSVLRDLEIIEQYFNEMPFDTLYLGGGTPSLLQEETLQQWFSYLQEQFHFQETTIEVNPATVSAEKFQLYNDLGINRLSIGIQSLNNEILQFLGRIHNAEEAKNVLDCASHYFENYSVDLIYNIPNFPSCYIYDSLRFMVENYKPKHISTYPLEIHEETPLGKRNIQTNDEQFAQEYEWIHDYLTSQGYIHYEVSNFCKPNYESKHNSKYWNHTPYLGIGPHAHSLWKNRRFCYDNLNDFIEQNTLRTIYENATILTEEEMQEEKIMLTARTLQGIPIHLCNTQFLEEYEKNKLLKVENNQIFITPHGWTVLNGLIIGLSMNE